MASPCCINLGRTVRVLNETVHNLSREVITLTNKLNKTEPFPFAKNPAIVTTVYLSAFFTWGILSNIDFITERWRTVQDIRTQGFAHLVVSILPVFYVGFYAYLQMKNEDFHEMMAAVVAILLCFYHVFRTGWGLMQVQAFREWCADCLRSMKALGMEIEDYNPWDQKLMVNNTLVDNEFTGTDLGVRLDVKNLRRNMEIWKASTWMTTRRAELCTVRWAASFLCSYGHCFKIWGHEGNLEKLYQCPEFVRALCSVTFYYRNGKEDNISMRSLIPLESRTFHATERAAYNDDLYPFNELSTFDQYHLEFQNTVSSYSVERFRAKHKKNKRAKEERPKSGVRHEPLDQEKNRNSVSISLVNLLMIVKQLDEDSTESIRLSPSYVFQTKQVRESAWTLLLEQCEAQTPDASSIHKLESAVASWNFALRPLWESRVNWRVFQASAHHDNYKALRLESNDGKSNESTRGRFFGVTMEAVRSFLGCWLLLKQQQHPEFTANWTPVIPSEASILKLSYEMQYWYYYIDYEPIRNRLLWECQLGLHSEIASLFESHDEFPVDLPADHRIILLFILGFPNLEISKDKSTYDPDGSQHQFRLRPLNAPQKIRINLLVDEKRNGEESDAVELKLEYYGNETKFVWQEWINAAIESMRKDEPALQAFDAQNSSVTSSSQRLAATADLAKPMLPINVNGKKIWMWTGWPIYNEKVCTFEINQWLKAVDVDPYAEISETDETVSRTDPELFNEEVKKAEKRLSEIIQGVQYAINVDDVMVTPD